MQFSHSRIETYTKCPYKFKLRYIDKLETLPTDDPSSPLILGSALHLGIEKDDQAAQSYYYDSYPIISDKHITECMKLKHWIPKVKALLPPGEHEVKIENKDFVGFIDLLVPVSPNTYDLYDFKYSNNVDTYMQSGQLHTYKYYFERINQSKKIRKLYFVFIPKSFLRMKHKNKTNPRDETIFEFRQRVINDLMNKEIQIIEIKYNPDKVKEFRRNKRVCVKDNEYIKKESRLCKFCEYYLLCQKGENWNLLQ